MKEEVKDYSEYAFRKTAKLEVGPIFLDDVQRVLDLALGKEGVGSHYLTEPRFEYVDKETSKVTKVTKKNQGQVKKVFSLAKTMSAEPTQYLTPLGKQILALMAEIDTVKAENIDLGRGELIEDLRKEMQANSELLEGKA